jgi:hypothetical protein
MTKKLLFVTTLLLVVAFAAVAADLSGKWTFQQAGRQGGDPVTVTMTLKADGAKLTGTVSRPGPNGNMDSEISDGKVDGDNVTFKTVMSFGDQSFTTSYAGAVAGSEMKLKVTRPGRGGGEPVTTEVTAKKAS